MGRLLKHILKSYIGLFSPVSLSCDNALGWLLTDLTCANLFSCICLWSCWNCYSSSFVMAQTVLDGHRTLSHTTPEIPLPK